MKKRSNGGEVVRLGLLDAENEMKETMLAAAYGKWVY